MTHIGLFLLTLAAPGQAPPAAKPAMTFEEARAYLAEVDRLLGSWQVVSLVDDGRPAAAETLRENRLVIMPQRLQFRRGTTVLSEWGYDLDLAAKVRVVKLTGPKASFPCIYQVDGDRLLFCCSATGEAPTAFEARPGSRRQLIEYRRISPPAPPAVPDPPAPPAVDKGAVPNRAAPGALVVLKGVAAKEEDEVSVRFGETAAAIVRQGEGDLVVSVPLFTDEAGRVAVPPRPVPVVVQVGRAAALTVEPRFTVDPLPPSPGTTEAVLAEVEGFGDFLDAWVSQCLKPAADSGNVDRQALENAEVVVKVLRRVLTDPDNPDSLRSLLAGTSPSLRGVALSRDVQDALIAQGGSLDRLRRMAADLGAIAAATQPDALPAPAGGGGPGYAPAGGAGPREVKLYYDPNDPRWKPLRLQYERMSRAEKAIMTLRVAGWLRRLAEQHGLFEAVGGGLFGLGTLAALLPVGQAKVVGGVITSTGAGVIFAEKLLIALVSTLPSDVADFYVQVGPAARHNNDPPVDVPKGGRVQLTAYLVVASPGGKVVSLADLASLAARSARKKLPAVLARGEEAAEAVIAKKLKEVWGLNRKVQAERTDPDKGLIREGEGEASVVGPKKYPPLEIGDDRIVTIRTRSPRLLAVGTHPNHTYYLQGVEVGKNAGFEATFTKERLISEDVPTLKRMVEESRLKKVPSKIIGVVNVPGPVPGGNPLFYPWYSTAGDQIGLINAQTGEKGPFR